MKTILISGLLIFFTISYLNAQSQKISAEELEFLKTFSFELGNNFFHDERPLTSEVDETFLLPWNAQEPIHPSLSKALNLAINNAKFSLKDVFGETNLIVDITVKLGADIPCSYGSDFAIEIIDRELVDENNSLVQLAEIEPSSHNISTLTELRNGEHHVSVEYSFLFRLVNQPKSVSGKLSLQYSTYTGFDYKLITQKNIGEELIWKKNRYKLIQMDEGKALFEVPYGNEIKEFDYLCTNANGLAYVEPASSFDFGSIGSGNSRLEIKPIMFSFFSENNGPTIEEYSAYVDKNIDLFLNQKSNYLGISSVGSIDRLYFYEKEFRKEGVISKNVQTDE